QLLQLLGGVVEVLGVRRIDLEDDPGRAGEVHGRRVAGDCLARRQRRLVQGVTLAGGEVGTGYGSGVPYEEDHVAVGQSEAVPAGGGGDDRGSIVPVGPGAVVGVAVGAAVVEDQQDLARGRLVDRDRGRVAEHQQARGGRGGVRDEPRQRQ